MWIKHIIELCFSLGLLINAVLFIPQSIRLIQTKNAAGASLITFLGFWLIQLTTVLHGLIHHDYLLAIGTLISMITCGHVVYLIIYYRLKNDPVSGSLAC